MNTDALIEQLASRRPPRLAQVPRTGFALPMAGAVVLAGALLTAALGSPAEPLAQAGAAAFAMKLAFSLAVMLASGAALFANGRPGAALRGKLAILALPFLTVAVLAGSELLAAEPAWPGESWVRCLAAIGLLTPLAFGAAMLALRRLAPVALHVSGALAGMLAASTGATAYTLWCPETEALFLLSWYAAPMAAAAAIGAWLGPRLLRW